MMGTSKNGSISERLDPFILVPSIGLHEDVLVLCRSVIYSSAKSSWPAILNSESPFVGYGWGIRLRSEQKEIEH
jgi:hypothetical protein